MIQSRQVGSADEDRSYGYALAKDPALRAKQLEIRAFALANQPSLLQVLKSSANAFDRAVAAHFLGYAEQSPRQLAALTRAVSDPDATVRNNAARAIEAQWRSKGHAQPSLTILGRMAGIEEERLQDLLASDQREEILRAVRQRP